MPRKTASGSPYDAMANDERLHGDNIYADCDFPGCDRRVERDALHTCRFCHGWYCDGHILVGNGGTICRKCYEANQKQVDDE